METQTAPPAAGHPPTPLFLLIEAKLGEPLIQMILDRRDPQRKEGNGPVAYWRIAQEIRGRTGVDLTLEAVRRWHRWHLDSQGTEGIERP